MHNAFLAVALLLACVSIVCLAFALAAWKKRRAVSVAFGTLVALLFLSLAGLFAVLSVATQGYRALTAEQVAAEVEITPTGHQTFWARFHFPDGRDTTFALSGDEIYIDAHILKWKSFANVLGLHTAYELDRVGGRYRELADEQAQTRTIYALSRVKPLDLFDLRQRYVLLALLLDAEYGSATFVGATEPARFELRVSTSGLLIRQIPDGPE